MSYCQNSFRGDSVHNDEFWPWLNMVVANKMHHGSRGESGLGGSWSR